LTEHSANRLGELESVRIRHETVRESRQVTRRAAHQPVSVGVTGFLLAGAGRFIVQAHIALRMAPVSLEKLL